MTDETRNRRLVHSALVIAGRPMTATELSRALPAGIAHPRRVALACLQELIRAEVVRPIEFTRPDGASLTLYGLLPARSEVPR